MDSVIADIRFALRALIRRPGLAFASIASLGVGLAATTAVFSVVNAALFKPIPGVTRPERLVEVARSVGGEQTDVTWQVYARLRQQTNVLDDLAALQLAQVAILGDGEPVALGALAVTANYFDLLGVRTALGRTFAADEASYPRVVPVAVITHDAWQRELGGDSAVIGRVVRVNGVAVEIIGVTVDGFTGHHTALLQDVFLPLGLAMPGLTERSAFEEPNGSSLEMLGRLRGAISPEAAALALSSVADQVDRETVGPGNRPAYIIAVDRWGPLPSSVRRGVAAFLGVLFGLVGLALVMSCVNVTTIVVARALDRQRELAVRRAIGATRGRLVRQIVTEVSVLFAVAGAVGVLLSAWATRLLSFAPPVPVPGRFGADFSPDARVFAFSLAATFGAALTFSLLPALNASRFDIVPALREGGSSDSRSRSRLRASLVGAQMAFTAVLLVATTVFGRALESVRAAQPAWNLDGVFVTPVDMELNGTSDDGGRALRREMRERIAAIPGVEAVAFAAKLPMGGRSSFGFTYPAGSDPSTHAGLDASINRVTPGYFRSMQLTLRGRDLADSDAESSPRVAIVNETMAQRLFPGVDPIGRRFFIGSGESRVEFDVIGVAADARITLPGRPSEPQYYLTQSQFYNSSSVLHVRAVPGAERSIAAPVREAIRAVAPTLPVAAPRPITEALEVFLLPQRIATWVAAAMGLFGLLLAAVGVYGVTAYAVSRRGREIAIRIALGAAPGNVAQLVLLQGARAPLVGTVIGLAVGAALTVVVGRLGIVPGVRVADPVVVLTAPLVLGSVALASMWAPVRRAIRRPAMSALREE